MGAAARAVEFVDGDVRSLVAEDLVEELPMVRPGEHGVEAHQAESRIGPAKRRAQSGTELDAGASFQLRNPP
jgi:hypothetical protein